MANLIETHREQVAALCRRTRAKRLDVFGSAARTDFDPATSDLDFLVEFDELPPAEYADAFFTLKESLEALFGRSVGLITEAALENPYFSRARLRRAETVVCTLTLPNCCGCAQRRFAMRWRANARPDPANRDRRLIRCRPSGSSLFPSAVSPDREALSADARPVRASKHVRLASVRQ